MEILELNREGLKKIATLDPSTMEINYTRTEAEVYSQVTQSLQNKTVIVAAKLGMPWLREKWVWVHFNKEWGGGVILIFCREKKEGEYFEGNDKYEGYSLDLIDGIAKILGFHYKFEIVPDNAYGSYDKKTKKWNGLVKHLLDRVSNENNLFYLKNTCEVSPVERFEQDTNLTETILYNLCSQIT